MIMNQAQAKAVADAMCALNNVGGKIDCWIDGVINVMESRTGEVFVHYQGVGTTLDEPYADQNAFMSAYGVAE